MSGIYGIYRYDGAPVDPQWLERMRKAMTYYGPHGSGCKIDGPIGMGHLLLEVNPEDAFEHQPMRCRRGLVVTSVRLDNRDALLEAFEISSSEAPRISDGHLVSLAFDRWGEDVCTHLEGDWALAAWDTKERRLLLARDAIGMAALYYYQGKGFIAFASSMKALLIVPEIHTEPDFLRLAEILVWWRNDPELTAYKNFRSLIGAQALTITSVGQVLDRRFWSYGSRKQLRYRRDEEYAEAFLERYTRAVKSCLRTRKQVAAELSGGRDSGSVVTLAAQILAHEGRDLTAYTAVPYLSPDGAGPKHEGNEWESAHATATMAGPNVRHIPVHSNGYGVLDSIHYFLNVHDGPCQSPSNLYWSQAIMENCRQREASILLSGQMGNATVSWTGNGLALFALLHGDPSTACRLLLQGEPSAWLTLKRQILKTLLTPAWSLLRIARTRGSPWETHSALSKGMAEQLNLRDRMRSAGYDPSHTFSPLEDIRGRILSSEFGGSDNFWSDCSYWYALPCLDPTANLSLIEFLLSVPDDQFYRKGESSLLIRRAFQGRMPANTLSGVRKGMQAADLGHRISRELPAFNECLRSLESVPEARDMLDFPRLHRCITELLAGVNAKSTLGAMYVLLGGLNVGLFLRHLALPNTSNPVQSC